MTDREDAVAEHPVADGGTGISSTDIAAPQVERGTLTPVLVPVLQAFAGERSVPGAPQRLPMYPLPC